MKSITTSRRAGPSAANAAVWRNKATTPGARAKPPAISLRRAGGTPALRLRVLASKATATKPMDRAGILAEQFLGENAKEISSLISAGT